jgi:V/A-type H+-transporting ATPase subunit I
MFFPKAMYELELIVPSKDLLGVMKVLSGHGVFHQSESGYPALESETGTPNTWQDKASAYAALERRVQSVLQTLAIEENQPLSIDFQDVVELEAVTPILESIEGEVKQTSDQLAEERKRLEQLESTLRQLEPVADINLDISSLRNSHYLFSTLGVMPAANVERLQTSLARVPHVFLTLRADPKNPVVWLAGTQTNTDILERAARSAYLNPLSLPQSYEGTPEEIIKLLHKEVEIGKQRISELKTTLTHLAETYKKQLLTMLWEIHASRLIADAIVRFGRLRHTYVIVGWVPSDELEDLISRIKSASKESLIETFPTNRHGENQNIPVALQNSKFLRPFQMLVTTYARPRYGELDPTWLIALTFPLLFGAMFGDVGHGILLAGLGALISSRKVRALNSLAGLGGLITICGLAATFFGFLYGSFFGFEDAIPALWLVPSKDPLPILAVAIGAGVVLLTIGFLIGIFNAYISHNWGRLFFGHNGIAGFVLYWSLIGLLASSLGRISIPSIVFMVSTAVAGLAIMFSEVFIHLVEGRRPLLEGGLGTYAVQAPMELFETVISFLSNSLSYVRIGAFAIAHGVLSSVIFILAQLVGSSHGVGYWTVVAVGNLFIVGFEGLIVGIQTMRLEYYEFFSKFFTGGGMRFEPLTLTPSKED